MRLVVGLVVGLVCSSAFAAEAVQRTLSFEERVKAQEAIDRVYYSHQIGATKPFEEAVSRTVLENKVHKYLGQTAALQTYWKTAVTDETLQAELTRMTTGSRMPERLTELFAALGNDPFVIKECLVRLDLVDRLTHNFYAMDPTMHVKERAVAETLRRRLVGGALDPNAEHANRTVTEIEIADAVADEPTSQQRTDHGSTLAEFQKQRSSLPDQVGQASEVQETRDEFAFDVILSENATRLRVARYSVRKTPWDDWWAIARLTLKGRSIAAVASGDADLQLLTKQFSAKQLGTCPESGWDNRSLDDIPQGRTRHSAVWTGSEMLVWGGIADGIYFGSNTGSRYNPATDTWSSIATVSAPGPRLDHTAIWTGREMVIWGGDRSLSVESLDTGGRYDPTTDTWERTSTVGAPRARELHSAVWTGTKMIVWGGTNIPRGGGGYHTPLNTGGSYDPETDTWSAISTIGAPPAGAGHSALWTGRLMLIWGTSWFAGRYDPATDTWSPVSQTGAPETDFGHSAIWTGRFMVIWGGARRVFDDDDDGGAFAGGIPEDVNTGARYNPATDRWSATSIVGAPSRRSGHTAVWTGDSMLIWSGGTGGRYDVTSDTWSPITTVGAPEIRELHTAIWTGQQMVVWGGSARLPYPFTYLGGRYDPITDSWTPTSVGPRGGSKAVWTGNEMVTLLGNRYNPATDTWRSMSFVGAPSIDSEFSAIWTGSEIIAWGGTWGGYYLNTGGRYDPMTDSWSLTSTEGAPSARAKHTAVWTGSSMVIWGGYLPTSGGGGQLDTGARYDPQTDTWTPVSATGAPSARSNHTAVWTGDAIVVWGGLFEPNFYTTIPLNTGGRYNPGDDTWTLTSMTGVPAARSDHAGVMVGSSMIVWGSANAAGGRYDPVGDLWTPVATIGEPPSGNTRVAESTGPMMIVWGSTYGSTVGGWYDPVTDRWTKIPTKGQPNPGGPYTGVWTGRELIVWGVSRGGRYVLRTSLDTDCDGDGVSPSAGDCDDLDASTYPNAPPACDGVGNDCYFLFWPQIPDPNVESDIDEDGFRFCSGDCNDSSASVYPGAPQLCDGLANDCSDPEWPTLPADERDVDGDRQPICAGDCDDTENDVWSGRREWCDGLDNNCDGTIDNGGDSLCEDEEYLCVNATCQGVNGCVLGFNAKACDDGYPCTVDDVCSDGACRGTPQVGEPCDDLNECTFDDRCGSSDCRGTPNTGKYCDDQNSCTVDDTCTGSGDCYGAAVEPGAECDDGNACTTDARCSYIGYCEPTVGRDCNDHDPCNGIDYCDSLTGECSHYGQPDCDDHNECTADSCVPFEGCMHVPITDPCDDGDVCTVGDTCVDGRCLWGPVTVCADDNPCTDDSCHFTTGCVFTPNAAACDDGNPCEIDDRCSEGACHGGSPIICTPVDQCHSAGVCDPASGACSTPVAPDGTLCTDNDLCTTGDACRTGTCTPAYNGLDHPKPRPLGYYKRLCDGPHSGDLLTDADAVCVAEVASTFSGISTVADLCEELTPSQPTIDPCELNEDELLILALNICRARACTEQSIASRCGGPELVGQSLAESDHLFASASRDTMTCARARCLAAEINTGRAIERNTQPASTMPPTPEP